MWLLKLRFKLSEIVVMSYEQRKTSETENECVTTMTDTVMNVTVSVDWDKKELYKVKPLDSIVMIIISHLNFTHVRHITGGPKILK